MKTALLLATALPFAILPACADTIAQWNFNSPSPDGSVSTGTLAPSIGTSTALAAGGIKATNFTTGDSKSDPAGSTDNSAWQTETYPSATNNNKSAGVRFDVSTLGYENITLSWAQRHSATASRYLRVQYTLDGTSFLDADGIAVLADGVFTNFTVNLGAISGATNNPAFGVRIVTEFESSATGSGTNAYVATKTGSTYGAAGTIRFDMVTVSGTPIPGANTPPNISDLTDQTLRVGQSSDALPVSIWDAEDTAANLRLASATSDPTVIPEANIAFGGSGGSRSVTVTAADQPGTATVTLYVIDTGARSNRTSFRVTVLPANTAPTLSPPTAANTLLNTPTQPLPFSVGDLETPADSLAITAVSANPALVPNTPANLALSGSGPDRTLVLTPAPSQAGVAPVTLCVSDGTNTTCAVFPVMVVPSPATLFFEPFSYANGSLLTNSGFLWNNRSGTFGQCQVTNQQLLLAADQTEDVVAPLIGGPYVKSNGTVLYASFQATFLSLPKAASGTFAHFANGSTLRGRISAGTTNALPGAFRLFVGNGTETTNHLAADLHLDTAYTLVTRYDLDAASTTLWLNPTAESDPGVTAQDPQFANNIASFGFRQDSDVGATLLIDDLRVGLTFDAVVAGAAAPAIPLAFQRVGTDLVLSWTNAAFVLQSAPAVTGAFTNIPAAASPYPVPMAGSSRFFRLIR